MPQKETACLHKTVTLHCATSSAFPLAQLTLYNGSSVLFTTNLSTLSHTITVSSSKDFKQYSCIASNLIGSDGINITVDPTGKCRLENLSILCVTLHSVTAYDISFLIKITLYSRLVFILCKFYQDTFQCL